VWRAAAQTIDMANIEDTKIVNKNLTRRTLLKSIAVALPASAVILQQDTMADDLPKLDPSDPTAMALVYVEDPADLDKSNPAAARYQAGQTCANCIQIQGDSGDYRPYGIFPGKTVAAAGWCSVWAPMT
jgi:hypothetical protein